MRLLNKPEYVFRPHRVLSRLLFRLHQNDPFADIRLPWGLSIRVRPADTIGRSICTYGLYDLVVSEAIIRLLDPGEMAVDIGANVGHMTGLMAWRSGSRGNVICFEPCSTVYRDLTTNLSQWKNDARLAPITVWQLALSSSDGEADLYIPSSFDDNRGTASLESCSPGGASVLSEKIRTSRLDTVLPGNAIVGVMKIDIEGHEFACLQGAADMLSGRRVRDIIFEEHEEYPTPAQKLLESFGYTIYRLSRTFLKPTLRPCNIPGQTPAISILPNNLATLDAKRAETRFSRSGWRALSLKVR